MSAHREGGFGRERPFTGLSGGGRQWRGVQIGCLVPNSSPAHRKDKNNAG